MEEAGIQAMLLSQSPASVGVKSCTFDWSPKVSLAGCRGKGRYPWNEALPSAGSEGRADAGRDMLGSGGPSVAPHRGIGPAWPGMEGLCSKEQCSAQLARAQATQADEISSC